MEQVVTLLVELKDFLSKCSPVAILNHFLSEDIFVTILGVFERSNPELFGIDFIGVQSSYLKSSIVRHDQLISGFQQLAY